jgi:hypothetical protein
MQDRLSRLVTIFGDLDFRGSRAEGDDLLGDAYEYLMRHFATESGKSKGQFYTPAEVMASLRNLAISLHPQEPPTSPRPYDITAVTPADHSNYSKSSDFADTLGQLAADQLATSSGRSRQPISGTHDAALVGLRRRR